jgi:solute carrier family 25 phosphate transporter 23/24/25/41
MQLSGKPFVETLRGVLSEGGMRALYRGILPECFKVAPGMGLAFLTYEALKASL